MFGHILSVTFVQMLKLHVHTQTVIKNMNNRHQKLKSLADTSLEFIPDYMHHQTLPKQLLENPKISKSSTQTNNWVTQIRNRIEKRSRRTCAATVLASCYKLLSDYNARNNPGHVSKMLHQFNYRVA